MADVGRQVVDTNRVDLDGIAVSGSFTDQKVGETYTQTLHQSGIAQARGLVAERVGVAGEARGAARLIAARRLTTLLSTHQNQIDILTQLR